MKQNEPDRGLRRALGPTPYRLPSNFTFQTMRMVEASARAREKRQNRNLLWAVAVLSGILCGSGCLIVAYYVGGLGLHLDWGQLFAPLAIWTQIPFCYQMLLPVLLLLLFFDRWLRKSYGHTQV